MKPTAIYEFDVPALGAFNLNVGGDFFKILAATGSVRVDGETIRLDGIGAGQGLEQTPFSRLTITDRSGAPNTVRMVIGDEKFVDASVGGSIAVNSTVMPVGSAFVTAAPVVTNASNIIKPMSSTRKYLLVQNRDPVGSIVLAFGGAAVWATGVEIGPGGSWEPAVVPTQAIHAIGNIASNPNVMLVTA